MQRTLNYTGRRKIEKKEALFSFTEEADGVPEFNVLFSFDEAEYPADASIYVEAHHKETRQRYDFGKISKITPPADRKLKEIDLSGPTLFKVLIVDESGRHGLLLASGEEFRADADNKDDENKSSLLAVVTRPLGQLTWTVEFETGGMPELCLNSRIPNAIEKMRLDPIFQALILPAALRQVLTYYLWNNDDEEDSESCQHWMAFSKLFAESKPESDDPSDLLNWIDEVVEGFTTRFDLSDRLVNASREEGVRN